MSGAPANWISPLMDQNWNTAVFDYDHERTERLWQKPTEGVGTCSELRGRMLQQQHPYFPAANYMLVVDFYVFCINQIFCDNRGNKRSFNVGIWGLSNLLWQLVKDGLQCVSHSEPQPCDWNRWNECSFSPLQDDGLQMVWKRCLTADWPNLRSQRSAAAAPALSLLIMWKQKLGFHIDSLCDIMKICGCLKGQTAPKQFFISAVHVTGQWICEWAEYGGSMGVHVHPGDSGWVMASEIQIFFLEMIHHSWSRLDKRWNV